MPHKPPVPSPATRRRFMAHLVAVGAALGLKAGPAWARPEAGSVEVQTLNLRREDGTVLLDFALKVQLNPMAEEALKRGLPLYFMAQATLWRPRWYWRDERVARVERQWRVSHQPLTGQYRVSVGAIGQQHATLDDALAAVSRLTQWELTESGKAEGDRHYAEFVWRLDTTQLPRPLQFGLGGAADWTLGVERTLKLEP